MDNDHEAAPFDLFAGDRFRLERKDGLSFTIHDPSGPVAVARFRSAPQDWRNIFGMFNERFVPRTDYVLTDTDGTAYHEIIRHRGQQRSFTFQVNHADGTPLGTGTVGGLLKPKGELTDAGGRPVARVSFFPPITVRDADDVEVAEQLVEPTGTYFAATRNWMRFAPTAPAHTRLMVMAAWICWSVG